MRSSERRVEFNRSLSCGLRSRHDVSGRKDQVRGVVEQVSQSPVRQGITWIAVDGGLRIGEGLAESVFRVLLRVVTAAKVVGVSARVLGAAPVQCALLFTSESPCEVGDDSFGTGIFKSERVIGGDVKILRPQGLAV